jgi:hypothetical protein
MDGSAGFAIFLLAVVMFALGVALGNGCAADVHSVEGREGRYCFPNKTCYPDLSCRSNLCVK